MRGGDRIGLGNHKIIAEIQGALTQFYGAVGEEVKKCSITTDLETKEHTFKDGTKAGIAKKLTIVIDFGSSIVQPHSDFEGDFAMSCVGALEDNINGLMENSGDDEEPEDDGFDDLHWGTR